MILFMIMMILKCTSTSQYYNILSLDGGATKGIITLECVDQLENFAYEYAM